MRASRLLHILLILQNRGRQTAATLARELEVSMRTILRDVDAMTEAGLPVLVHRGNRGGIELGFNYRARLTGLTAAEAEALAIQFAAPASAIRDLGLGAAFTSGRAKLMESFPDTTRAHCAEALLRFEVAPHDPGPPDPYVAALADAVRNRRIVTLRARSADRAVCHPGRLVLSPDGWQVFDARDPDTAIPQSDWGDLNISARQYA